MKRQDSYSLKDLVAQTGIDKRTIYYYTQEGLLPRVGRRGPNTRYPREVFDRLMFIKRVRDLQDGGRLTNVSLADIRSAFDLMPHHVIGNAAEEGVLEALEGALTQIGREDLIGLSGVADSDSRYSIDAMVEPEDSAPARPAAAASSKMSSASRRRQMLMEDVSAETSRDILFSRRAPATKSPRRAEDVPAETSTFTAPLESYAVTEEPGTPYGTTELADLLQLLERRARIGGKMEARGAENWTRIPVTRNIVLTVRGLQEEDLTIATRVARWLERLVRGA